MIRQRLELPVRVSLDSRLVKKIKSLLAPLGFWLEKKGRSLFVVGGREDEVSRVALSLSIPLSLVAEGKRWGKITLKGRKIKIVLEDADLSEMVEELTKIRRLREQRELWRRAGLPDPLEAGRRGWWVLEQKALFVGEVPLSDEELQRRLEEAKILCARTLAHEIQNT